MYTVPLHAVMKSFISQMPHSCNTRWDLMSYSCERCLDTCAWKPGFLFVLPSNTGKLVEKLPTTLICLFQKELLCSSACRHCLLSAAEESSTYRLSPGLVHIGFATIIIKNVSDPNTNVLRLPFSCNEISTGL